MTLLYEACVTSVSQARLAARAGAGRLELCARLGAGGLTPPLDRLRAVCEATPLPVRVMIRHDRGDYQSDPRTVDRMVAGIAAAREAGAAGIVLGVLAPDRAPDLPALQVLMAAAAGLPVTFHRAFDAIPDPFGALDALAELGFDRILTSGGAPTARAGIPVLRRLVQAASGRIGIIAAGTIRADHAAALVGATGVREVHAHLTRLGEMRALAEALEVEAPGSGPSVHGDRPSGRVGP